MRVTDYIAEYIHGQGVSHVFLVSGGGMMFLTDGIAKHPTLEAVCTHHEQAAAMAAASYAKYRQAPGACYLTTGCGGTNAITGLLNAWQDSTPCFFISGQSKRKETVRNSGLRLRQFGVQEADIIEIAQSLTKYAVMVNKPELIAYHLEKATHLATSGRPGPVWLDLPLDVQGACIDPNALIHFHPEEDPAIQDAVPAGDDVDAVMALLGNAERPVILAGQGIRLAKAIPELEAFIARHKIPVVTSKMGVDLIPNGDPLFIGRVGTKGDRPGNMTVQNADAVVVLGCRLSVCTTGHEYSLFAREAQVMVVDIDRVEHAKNTVQIDRFVHADVKRLLAAALPSRETPPRTEWLEKCAHWKEAYPVYQPKHADDSSGISLYRFAHCLSEAMGDVATVVSDAGSAGFVATQAIQYGFGHRSVASGGQMEMGYTLPGVIGVAYAQEGGQVIGITGDGSFQMNIQELQTIVHNNLPVKLFVWNNDGYLSIRATQRKFFEGRFIGTDKASGVSFPDTERIAAAYGITFRRLSKSDALTESIREVLAVTGPVVCEVMCDPNEGIQPVVSSLRRDDGTMVSKPIEDMYPFLPRDEFLREMIVKPLDE